MNKQQLAARIWASANKMRSKIEANEYKDYILEDCRDILVNQVAAIEDDMMKNVLGCF